MLRLGFCVMGLLWASGVMACQHRTALEQVYCQLASKGVQLPSLEDFRRNPPQMQYLLLKRPAAARGIALPALAAKRKVKPEVRSEARRVTPAVQAPEPSAVQRQNNAAPSPRREACQLQRDTIVCGAERYRLVLNKLNRELSPGSLGELNVLRLPAYQKQHHSLNTYLTNSYQHYIEKMMSIGLGASTMSFTKFHYTWQQSQQHGHDFSERFNLVFEYLKKDKRSMGVQPSYDDALPQKMSWCESLDARLWVCDNSDRNWVYQGG